MQATYRAMIGPENDKAYRYLVVMGRLFGQLERRLGAPTQRVGRDAYVLGRGWAELKHEYIYKYGITARQFNSVYNSVAGKVSSVKENMKYRAQDLAGRIESLEQVIKKKEKARQKAVERLGKLKQGTKAWEITVEKLARIKFVLHQKKRRLRNLLQRLDNLTGDIAGERYRICFGSRKLFKAQYNLEANRFRDHSEWLERWRRARSSSIFVLGSKDESFGNQTCTYGSDNTLRIRVAERFTKEFGTYTEIPEVVFAYGQEQLDLARQPVRRKDAKGRSKKVYKSISYRFVCREGRWYVHATVERKDPDPVTSGWNGAVGLDLNYGFLAVGEVDRHGNPLGEFKIPVPMRDRTTEQIEAALGDALKEAVSFAVQRGKPVAIESLDFSRKKQSLGEQGAGYARMLSVLVYAKYQQMAASAAARAAVELIRRNPFATSVAGQLKFMVRYGLSSHGAAACVIARRGLDFRLERTVASSVLKLPERKRTTR
ncbi:MAG TPA: transposase, partial [Spirochaetia bacterium]|nr:transposase [Spirochaetia bacterium]